MNEEYVIGVFDDEEKLLKASQKIKNEKIQIVDFYTPFPVHGLDEILDITRSRLPYVTLGAGAFGLTLALTFQVWTSAFDWPINVGGKPMLSIPAFIPVTFELMVLCGALTTVAAFFFRAKLFPSQVAQSINLKQLDDKFLIVVRTSNNYEKTTSILKEHGALNVEKKKLELNDEN